jgi:hypothetical protein
MGLISIFLNIHAFAAYLPGVGDPNIDKFYNEAKIPVPPGGANGSAMSTVEQVVLSGLAYAKLIIVAVGILYITVMGFRMVISSDNDEQITNVKKGITYALIAFLIISMSQDIAEIFNYKNSTILQSPSEILKRVRIWDKQVEIFIQFIKYVITAFAGIMIVRSSLKLVTSGGSDEDTSKHRNSILFSIAGLLLVYGGEIFINKVFYVINKDKYTAAKGVELTVDVGQGVKEIVGLTNMVVSFVAPIAVLMIVVAAIMYLAAGGQEEKMQKAKRIIIAVVIGMVIVYGAFALVNTIVTGRLSVAENITTTTE